MLDETLGKAIEGTVFASVGSNMLALFIVFALLYWVGMARLVRGQILTVKENEYVLAARTIGTKPSRILRKHILPNCLSVIIISVALQVPSAIFTESYLSFLGLGVSAPMRFARQPREQCARRADELPASAGFPGGYDLPDRSGVQRFG